MATSINLDALIFAFTSILVLVSGHLLWFPEEKTRLQKWLLAVLAVLCIVFAMLTKFSGLLLAAIPGLFVIAWVDRIPFRKWIKRLLAAIFLVALALAIVFPYYYYRYYKTEGSFFPTNTVWVIHDGHTNSLRRRNANPTEFIRTFFTPEVSFFFPKHENISTLRTHAAGIPRLSDTWEDFWIADISPIPQAWKSVLTSLQYLQIMPWLLIVGLVSVLGIAWRIDIWARMGVVFFMYGSVQLAALFRYVYQNPDAGFKPTKAIYIVSVVWLLGLIISAPSWFIDRIPSSRPAFKMAKFILGTAILICVVIFMTTNHILPVY